MFLTFRLVLFDSLNDITSKEHFDDNLHKDDTLKNYFVLLTNAYSPFSFLFAF